MKSNTMISYKTNINKTNIVNDSHDLSKTLVHVEINSLET